MHKVSENTSSSFFRLPTPPALVQTFFSALYNSGTYLARSLTNSKTILAFGTGLVIYQIYQRYVKKEPVEQVYPDPALVSKYAKQIEDCLCHDKDVKPVDQAYTQLAKSCPNSSLKAQNVIDQLHLPEHVEEFRLNVLCSSFDSLTKEIALKLMSRQLIPEYATAIQNCLNNPSNENIEQVNQFLSKYPTALAQQIRPQSILERMDAAQCPDLATFETLAPKISAQSPAKAVIDQMHRHRLFEDYCATLQKYFDQEPHAKRSSNEQQQHTSSQSRRSPTESVDFQSLSVLKTTWDSTFPQHKLEPDDVIKKLSKDPLGLPTLQELNAIKLLFGTLVVDNLTKQVVEKLLKQRQNEQNIQTFVQVVTWFLNTQNNDAVIDRAFAELPPNVKIPSIDLRHIPSKVTGSNFALPQNELAQTLVRTAIRDKNAEILRRNYEEAFKAFLRNPSPTNANAANGLFSQLQVLTGQRQLPMTYIDPNMLPTAQELMKMRETAQGNERQIVNQLLVRQVKNELLAAAIAEKTDEHSFLIEINTKIAEEEKKKKYRGFSQNSFASSLSFSKGSHVKGRPEHEELLNLQKEFAVLKENIQQGLIDSQLDTSTLITRYARAGIAGSPTVAYEIAILIQIRRTTSFQSIFTDPVDQICTPEEFPLEKLSNLGSSYFNDPTFEDNVARPLRELRRARLWENLDKDEDHHELTPIAHLAHGTEKQCQRALQGADLVNLALAYQKASITRQVLLKNKMEERLSLHASLEETRQSFISMRKPESRNAYDKAVQLAYELIIKHIPNESNN